jgi:hypothetical protein
LRHRQEELEEAKEAILREIDATEHREERLRRLLDLLDRLRQRAATWDSLLEEHPDLSERVIPWEKLPPEVRERMAGPMPWHNDAFARAHMESLENATPEERHARYQELELRVEARSKDELEVTGIFGRETVYIWNPLPRRRRTATTWSSSTPTGWSCAAGGRDRTSRR